MTSNHTHTPVMRTVQRKMKMFLWEVSTLRTPQKQDYYYYYMQVVRFSWSGVPLCILDQGLSQ